LITNQNKQRQRKMTSTPEFQAALNIIRMFHAVLGWII